MIDIETVYSIPGFYNTDETYLLYRLASQSQTMVEIGTYYGRTAYILGCGAKVSGGHVTTIDPYTPHVIGEMTVSPEIAPIVKAMLKDRGLSKYVTPIVGDARAVAKTWNTPIDLLFIDGSHEYKDAKADFNAWKKHVDGLIAFHDYADAWPGIQRLVNEIVEAGQWEIAHRADATVVLKRVAK